MKLKCLKLSKLEKDKVFFIILIKFIIFYINDSEKSWKRMVTKVTFVGEGFTRKPPKYERFIRPTALRYYFSEQTHFFA